MIEELRGMDYLYLHNGNIITIMMGLAQLELPWQIGRGGLNGMAYS
jgi:hypothetical protein